MRAIRFEMLNERTQKQKKNDAKHRVHLQSIEAAHFEKLGQLSHLSRLNARCETVIQHYKILQRRGS